MNKLKTLLLSLLITLNLSATDYKFCENWTTSDTKREIVWVVINSIDINQTKQFRYGPDGKSKEWEYYEINPFVGKHPSNKRLNTFLILGTMAHVTCSMVLPPKYRSKFQYVSIFLSSSAVIHNYNLGFKVKY